MRYDMIVWGVGRIGYAAAYDLKRLGFKILAVDISDAALDKVSKNLDIPTAKVDPDFKWLPEYRRLSEIIVSSLPAPHAYRSVEAALKSGYNVVDATSLTGMDPTPLDKIARDNKVYAVLYAGVAPGMTHVLSGALYRELDGLDRLEIYCGGMPLDPRGKPLLTNVTWSPIGYLGIYARKSRMVIDGKVVYKDPLEETGLIEFPGEGEYEYLLSDGLRSLLLNFKDVPYMAEYSLRWKGHVSQMKLIRDLGFLSKEPMEVEGCNVVPIEFTAKIIEKVLSKDPRDKVLTLVKGVRRGVSGIYYNVEKFDERTGLTAMQRTTGFNLSRLAKMAYEGEMPRKVGANYPEEYGLIEDLFKVYLENMEAVGIKIKRVS